MYQSFRMHFTRDLLYARLARNYTQQQAADRAGLSLRGYQRIENGDRVPKTPTFLRLVFLFDLDVSAYRADKEFQLEEPFAWKR